MLRRSKKPLLRGRRVTTLHLLKPCLSRRCFRAGSRLVSKVGVRVLIRGRTVLPLLPLRPSLELHRCHEVLREGVRVLARGRAVLPLLFLQQSQEPHHYHEVRAMAKGALPLGRALAGKVQQQTHAEDK